MLFKVISLFLAKLMEKTEKSTIDGYKRYCP